METVPANEMHLKKIDRILEHKRGCLTCRSPDCPVWQAADQNCWKSEKEALKCQTCGGVVTHPMCDSCYENNIENTLQEALKAEREGIITKLETRKENYKKYVVGVEMKELARIRIEEIEGIIESLRSEQP